MALSKPAFYSTLGLLALVAAGGAWSLSADEGAGATQTTDDAHVEADISTVAPKIAGRVAKVLVDEGTYVKAGQAIATIEDEDQQAALAAAQADLAGAKAAAVAARAGLARQGSVIAQAAAAVQADQSGIALAGANAQRYRALAGDGSASRQEQQQAADALAQAQAAHSRDSAGESATRQQSAILAANVAAADAAIARAQAAVDSAKLNLRYTSILAPVDGVVGHKTVNVGNYVQPGTPLLTVVPLQAVYVMAHYRETQLRRIRAGQSVNLSFDLMPGVTLKGHVLSLSPASGVALAGMGPENASGNFTKITQRLPVKITIDPDQKAAAGLRLGMSATARVETAG
ncbi:MAG TPA: HlyD family secretion protein [Novosphingobium sp.]|nr:HlyD family secretion protein [Novosphingobium sp.]